MWINQIYGYFYSIGFCEYINIRNSILGLEKSDFSKKHIIAILLTLFPKLTDILEIPYASLLNPSWNFDLTQI